MTERALGKWMRETNDFALWMRTVDAAVMALVGVSAHDLPDAPFRDWFDDGLGAMSAARRVIKLAKEDM